MLLFVPICSAPCSALCAATYGLRMHSAQPYSTILALFARIICRPNYHVSSYTALKRTAWWTASSGRSIGNNMR
jgi:hypothetical protein